MKMTMKEMAMAAGIMGLLGYCYLIKNPETVKKAKKAVKKTGAKVSDVLEKVD